MWAMLIQALWSTMLKLGASLLRFFQTPVGRIVGLVILLLLSYAFVWHRAETVTSARYERQIQAQEAQALALLKKRHAASLAINQDLQAQLDKQKLQHTVVKTVIKEVKKYVTVQADAQCVVPAGFVWMHNVALDPGLADRPPGDVDAPSGIALSTVASTVASNYDECQVRGELLTAWQLWYDKHKKLWEDSGKKRAKTQKK